MAPMLALHDDWLSSEDASVPSDRDGAHASEDGAPSSLEPGLATGTLVDEVYRIVAPLGSGSMGTVYLAHDETLDRRVAIKVARAHLMDATFHARFLAEARAMARVKHPNVLSVFAFGEHERAPYFVMDFVQGGTLQEWLDGCDGPPDLDVAFRILDGMCRGVSAIHAAHTIHQDIKPDNVLLDKNLRPRIADLGLAVEQRGGRGDREIVGTPTYMAPEIAFPRALDTSLRARADVYSLACVAYQLLTGRPPFDGSGNMGMLLQHAMKTVVAPSKLRAGLSPAIDKVILSGLAKDPRARTATAEDFRRGLMAARRQMRQKRSVLALVETETELEAPQSGVTAPATASPRSTTKDRRRAPSSLASAAIATSASSPIATARALLNLALRFAPRARERRVAEAPQNGGSSMKLAKLSSALRSPSSPLSGRAPRGRKTWSSPSARGRPGACADPQSMSETVDGQGRSEPDAPHERARHVPGSPTGRASSSRRRAASTPTTGCSCPWWGRGRPSRIGRTVAAAGGLATARRPTRSSSWPTASARRSAHS